MDLKYFDQQIRLAQQHISNLQVQDIPAEELRPMLDQTMSQYASVLEELHVALEEMWEQDQTLQVTHTQLLQEQRRYLQLFEFAPDPYLVTDMHGNIRAANQAAIALLNVPRAHFLLRKPLAVFITKEHVATYHSHLENLQQGKLIKNWELEMRPRHRDPFPAMVSVSVMHHPSDRMPELYWLIRDLTEHKQVEEERRQLQQLQELNELKSRFIQTASHEIRNPLNTILLSASLLERSNQRMATQTRALMLKKIQSAARSITRLVEDVLTLSKADAAKLEFQPAQLDLTKFCFDLVGEQQLLAEPNREIRLIRSSQACIGHWDQRLLQQMLANLISNALKYSPAEAAVEVELSVEDDQAVIQVRDQGLGIPKMEQEHLFEPFHRATNVKNLPGSGIGLSIVKRAVELHQGTITVDSDLGQGTTVTLYLPLQPDSSVLT